jgi:hypothetical protein
MFMPALWPPMHPASAACPQVSVLEPLRVVDVPVEGVGVGDGGAIDRRFGGDSLDQFLDGDFEPFACAGGGNGGDVDDFIRYVPG